MNVEHAAHRVHLLLLVLGRLLLLGHLMLFLARPLLLLLAPLLLLDLPVLLRDDPLAWHALHSPDLPPLGPAHDPARVLWASKCLDEELRGFVAGREGNEERDDQDRRGRRHVVV